MAKRKTRRNKGIIHLLNPIVKQEAGNNKAEIKLTTKPRRKLVGEWINDLERITKKMREDYEKGVFGNIRTEAMMIIKTAVHLRDEVAGLMAIESILEKQTK